MTTWQTYLNLEIKVLCLLLVNLYAKSELTPLLVVDLLQSTHTIFLGIINEHLS